MYVFVWEIAPWQCDAWTCVCVCVRDTQSEKVRQGVRGANHWNKYDSFATVAELNNSLCIQCQFEMLTKKCSVSVFSLFSTSKIRIIKSVTRYKCGKYMQLIIVEDCARRLHFFCCSCRCCCCCNCHCVWYECFAYRTSSNHGIPIATVQRN